MPKTAMMLLFCLYFPYGFCGHIHPHNDSPVMKFLQSVENAAWKHYALLRFLGTWYPIMFLLDCTCTGSPPCSFSFLCAISRSTGTMHKTMSPNIPVGIPRLPVALKQGILALVSCRSLSAAACLLASNVLPEPYSCVLIALRRWGRKALYSLSVYPWCQCMLHVPSLFLCEGLPSSLHGSSKQFMSSLSPAFPYWKQVSWASSCKLLCCQSLRGRTSLLIHDFTTSMPKTINTWEVK